jgi:hypothetical protein
MEYVSRAAPLHVNSYKVDCGSLPGLMHATGANSQVHASYGKLVVLMSVYEVKDGTLDIVVTFLPANKHTVGILTIHPPMWKFLAFGDITNHTHHELEQLAVKMCIALTAAMDDVPQPTPEPVELEQYSSTSDPAEMASRRLANRRRSSATAVSMRLAVEQRYSSAAAGAHVNSCE